ncbi:DUF4116 domain-containing protein [bacterium]|nr:DUF4116 domain-containing protein [bacterium]
MLVHFKNDKPFLLEVIKINPYLIKLMPEELKNDK